MMDTKTPTITAGGALLARLKAASGLAPKSRPTDQTTDSTENTDSFSSVQSVESVGELYFWAKPLSARPADQDALASSSRRRNGDRLGSAPLACGSFSGS